MKTQSNRLNSIVAATLMTLTLTACGSGSLPSELTTSSTAASTAPATIATLPLTGYANPASIQVGATSSIIASEGSGTYTYTYPGSTTRFGTLAGNVFTATVVGDATLNIVDSAGTVFPVVVHVVAAAVVAPPAPQTKLLYRYNQFTTAGVQMRLYIPSNVAPQGYTYENTTFPVLVDGTTAGTVALRECTDNSFVQSLFQSQDANCEGTNVGNVLGYVYSAPAAGLVAVRRYSIGYYSPYFGNLTDRLLIVGDAPGPQNYQLDRIVGYVPAQ